MKDGSYPFRFWVRRASGGERSFAVRYEVREGRGLLRMGRGEGGHDPPAATRGYAPDLSAEDLRSCRFLHVGATTTHRRTWLLSGLVDRVLDGLAGGVWVELEPVDRLGESHLAVPGGAAGGLVGVDAPWLADSDGLIAANGEPGGPPEEEVTNVTALPGPERLDGPPPTGLIRHLRRQLALERQRNAALSVRVAALERRLAELIAQRAGGAA